MKNSTRIALFPIVLMLTSLAGCHGDRSITVTVINQHNLPVENVVLTLNGKEAVTNSNGVAVIKNGSVSGTVKAKELPLGYTMEEPLKLDGMYDYEIVLKSSLITKEEYRKGVSLDIGSIGVDYIFQTVGYETDRYGNTTLTTNWISLKDKLSKNDCLILNFFYADCPPCKIETPVLIEGYAPHKDNGAYMVAIDRYDKTDHDETYLADAKREQQYNYDVGYDPDNMTETYGAFSYPTTVIIDRFGFVCFHMNGQILDSDEFSNLIDSFKGEDYEPVFYKKNSFQKQV
ncbi:MAG: redoxin domain-containing protein [Bacilli bacterium]|nr:redoxin domain-containing protein [Bacilli bacterium]